MSTTIPHTVVWLGVSVASLAASVVAQSPPAGGPAEAAASVPEARFSESVAVELVTVDVWVTDEAGDAVSGLDATEFELLHDGKPVAIEHFSEMRSAGSGRRQATRASGIATSLQQPSPESHLIVYLDRSRLHPVHLPAAIQGLRDLVRSGTVQPEQLMVLRQDEGLFVEAPFGSSARDLEDALDRLAEPSAGGADFETETEQALDAIRRIWEENRDVASSRAAGIAGASQPSAGGPPAGVPSGGPRGVVGGVGTGGASDACGSFVGQVQPVLASWARSRAARLERTLASLYDLTGFLAGLSGVKSLVYVSDGLETDPGNALATFAAGFCPTGATQLLAGTRTEDRSSAFLSLTRHANANRVTVHSLQATGLRAPRAQSAARGRRVRSGSERSGGSFEQTRRASERRGLEVLSGETGGRVVVNQNELGPGLRKIAADASGYYSLAYRPPAAVGREHRIEVRSKTSSHRLRYRRGYVSKDPSQRLAERTQGALNLGLSRNPLEVRLGAGEVEALPDGRYRLPLHVVVPAERIVFVPSPTESVAEIAIQVLTRPVEGGQVAKAGQTFRIRGAAGGAANTGSAALTVPLELPGGVYVTAVGVLDAASGEMSFVSTTLQIGS